MITLIVEWKVSEENKELFMENIKKLERKSREELGCMNYRAYKKVDDPETIVLIELWLSNTFLKQHKNTDHYMAIVPELESISLCEPKITKLVDIYEDDDGDCE